MPDVFLSYSREDQATARRFAEGLERAGLNVWWDQALHSGEAYDRITESALKEARAVVVLWSAHSVESRWVRAEATMADRRGTLVPVMIGPCERPLMFELTQAAELSHWKGQAGDPHWQAFVADVRRYVSREHPEPLPGSPPPRASWLQRMGSLRIALPLGLLLLVGAAAWLWQPQIGRLTEGLIGVGALSRSASPSVAVLPFTDMTAQGADSALAEGLSEEISNWLAQIPGLKIVARTSAFAFKGTNRDVREIGKLLNADYVLEGSVRRGEEQVRVTVQLITVADGYHRWSRTFSLPASDALQIEDSVSRLVAEALDTRLSEETERRWKARQSGEAQAYTLYLQGRQEQRRRTADSNLRAMELYRRAIAQDRRFALPYVGLAEATINSVPLNGRDLVAVAPEVTTLLDQADAISRDLPESTAARGWLAMEQFQTADALALMQRAVAQNPNDSDSQRRLGDLYVQMAQPRRAAERYDLAAELDPLDSMTLISKCLSLQDLAQFDAAGAACARARELDPAQLWGPVATAWLEQGRGDLTAALHWMDEAAKLTPDVVVAQQRRVPFLLALRRFAEAEQAVALLPAPAGLERGFLEAAIAQARDDRAALVTALAALGARGAELDTAQWLELSRLQLAAGNVPAARSALDAALQSPGWRPGALVNPDDVRLGYATAIIVASVEAAEGNREPALRALDALDEMLDRMEQGGAACNGLYSLRAESRALRGDPDRAMASLQQAYDRGWRQSVSARRDPYLQSLRDRSDFRQLLAQVDRQLDPSGIVPTR